MKIVFSFLVLTAVALGITAQAQAVTVDVGNSNAPWLGWMNVSELPDVGGAFVFGSGWGIADLVADFDDGAGTLQLRPNSIDDPDPYWYTPSGGPGSTGNKYMEANLYQEPDAGTLNGQTVQFDYSVSADTTTAAHEGFVFIKDFAPDYSSFVDTTVSLTVGAGQSISLATDPDPTRHVQFGFQFIGENVWITDVAPFGGITIDTVATPPPPQFPSYSQDFDSVGVAGTDPTALASGTQEDVQPGSDGKHGWTTYANVFDYTGAWKFGYGNFPAPNDDPPLAYSNVGVGQGAGGPTDQYLNTLSDYQCCDLGEPAGSQQGHGDNGLGTGFEDMVQSNLFQEYTVSSSDVGRDIELSFDIKLPGDFSGSGGDDLSALALGASGSATAEMFIKTLDPGDNYAESGRTDVDILTGIPGLNDTTWVNHTLAFTIDASMVGHVFQFGIESTASNFDPTGVYLDNINMDDTGTGDFDGDGDVDGNDFLLWQQGLGTSYDATDLTTWEANFGNVPAVSAVASVPEPAAAMLALIGIISLSAARRQSR